MKGDAVRRRSEIKESELLQPCTNLDERKSELADDGVGEEGLAAARRAVQQKPTGRRHAKLSELWRVFTLFRCKVHLKL